MSRSLNKAMIIGNLGSDPDIRTTSGGARVANFSVATSRSWTGRDGQQQEKTEWHRMVAWEKLADIAERFLKKGDRVYVEGEIEYRSYEDKDGVTKYMTEIRVREMIMLGGSSVGGGDFGGGSQERAPRAQRPAASNAKSESGGYEDFEPAPFGEEDDLPF
ncbi:MAG TPA: single-stranded DNA-binding protein [Longimicrobiaceae bacterium]|nr:single-stranded DNA-binding protein [Longimicrobiaceae bacterium]